MHPPRWQSALFIFLAAAGCARGTLNVEDELLSGDPSAAEAGADEPDAGTNVPPGDDPDPDDMKPDTPDA